MDSKRYSMGRKKIYSQPLTRESSLLSAGCKILIMTVPEKFVILIVEVTGLASKRYKKQIKRYRQSWKKH